MTHFHQNLTEGFHERLSSQVVAISERKKTKNLETIKQVKSKYIKMTFLKE